MPYFSCTPLKTTQLYALLLTIFVLSAVAPPVLTAQDDIGLEDPEAHLFMQRCYNCHDGVLSGRELLNTSARPVENLEDTVRRMQQYTGTLTDEQIDALVSLLHDEEVLFRIEEAKLERELKTEPEADPSGAPIDEYARLFVQSCAICHSIGGGGGPGGDLGPTINWDTTRLQSEVSRMQDRVGPLTNEQIAGLTALLKDETRMDRLESAGYKQSAPGTGPAVAGAIPAAIGYVPPIPTPSPTLEERRDAAVAAKIAAARAATAHTPHETQKPPIMLLIASSIIMLVAAIGAYSMVAKSESK